MKSKTGEQGTGIGRIGVWLLVASLLTSLTAAVPPLEAAAQAGGGEASFTAVTASRGAGSNGANSHELAVPARAQVGERVTFTLYGRSLQDLAGFHAVLRFDHLGLDFAAAELSPELEAQGSLIAVGPVEVDGAVHLGAASCPAAECSRVTDYGLAERRTPAAGGDLPLATFAFYVRQPGAYQLALDELKLFNAAGFSPAGPGSAPQSSVEPERLDVTGNLFINDADAYALLAQWADLVKQGVCLDEQTAAYDLDGSGCLDAADLQVVLAHWGSDIGPARSSPQPGLPAAPSGSEPGAANSPEQTVTFTVDSAGDGGDNAKGDGVCRTSGGACTLRAALEEANRRNGAERIHFNIRNAGGSCPAVVTLTPSSPLQIDDPEDDGITIDGYTQCGASPNSGGVSGNAVIKIELKGDLTPGKAGLRLYSSNNLVRGLAIYHFSDNLVLSGGRARDNRIEGNFVGTNAAQSEDTFIENDESDGILIGWGAKDNLIGGVGPEKRNIIAGNDQDGLGLQGSGTTGNEIYNNYIGVKQNGLTPLGNKSDGIDLAEGAASNTIGGTGAGQRNVLSGNHNDGIEISHTESTRNNRVTGNFIGLAADGASAAGNGERGVTFEDLVNGTEVNRNVIVANGGHGVRFYTAHENELHENFIGARPPQLGPESGIPNPASVAAGSLTAMPNGQRPDKQAGFSGIQFTGGSESNSIEKNVIANHPEYGIIADVTRGYLAEGSCNAYFNTFSQNLILNNGRLGIYLKAGECDNSPAAPNQGIQPPVITSATGGEVRGTACSNCTVEIFISDKNRLNHPSGENAGEASRYVARGNANGSGAFRISVSGVNGAVITATATDGRGNTSQFANNVMAGSGSGGSANSLYLPLLHNR